MRRVAAGFVLLLALAPELAFAQQNLIQNTKHNLSTSGTGAIKSAASGGTTEICVFCHTPHGSSSIAQLWNHEVKENTYTLYSSDYILSLPSYPAAAQPTTRSKLCLSCHDGTVALGSVYNMPGSGGWSGPWSGPPTPGGTIPMTGTTPEGWMPSSAAGYLGTNLTNDHPVGYMYNTTSDPELVVRPWPWETPTQKVKLDPDSASGTVECQTCHDPHNNQLTKFLRMQITNGTSTNYLCTYCHNKTGYTASGHQSVAAAAASYTPAGGTPTNVAEYSCRSCHKPHSSGGTPYILRGAEENTCYEKGCHGTNTAYTDPATPATPAARLIQPELIKMHYHPVNKPTASVPVTSGLHKNVSGGESQTQLGGAGAANRHAECMDCHNPHQAQAAVATTTRGAIGISAALTGTWGVTVPIWPLPPSDVAGATLPALTTNAVTFEPVPAGAYSKVSPGSVSDEYQVCLKCHSNYVTLPAGARDIGKEINPRNSSYHGIVPGGTTNTFVDTTTANEPWATNKRVWCSDCHGSEAGSGVSPKGPHGSSLNNTGPGTSNTDKMLVATIATNTTNGGTPLCLVCHKSTSYLTGSTGSNTNRHGQDTNLSRAPQGCFSCHMWENPAVVTGGTGKIFPHGMNKRWALVATGPDTGSLEMVNAFNGGWYTNIKYSSPRQCWTVTTLTGKTLPSGSPCNAHTGQAY